jgi:hypothetical protein
MVNVIYFPQKTLATCLCGANAYKKDALIRERNLKKAETQRINALIHHTKNIVRDFQ